MTTTTTETATLSRVQFETQLAAFVAGGTEKARAFYAEQYPTMPWQETWGLGVNRGQKMVKVWSSDNGVTAKSVHCFIEIETGKVIKPAGWKAPAKRSNGEWQSQFSIATEEALATVLAAFDPYGSYLYQR